MPLNPDPRWRWRLLSWVTGVGMVFFLVALGWWAFRPLAPATLPGRGSSPNSATSAEPAQALNPQAFQVSLWRPLVDQPVQVASAAPSPTVKLFSIFQRDGQSVAALDVTGTSGLVYLKQGETAGQVIAESVESSRVVLSVAGQRITLETAR